MAIMTIAATIAIVIIAAIMTIATTITMAAIMIIAITVTVGEITCRLSQTEAHTTAISMAAMMQTDMV